MNIQDELQKIHHQYGTSERANYEIEKLFDKEILPYKIKSAKWEQLLEKLQQVRSVGFNRSNQAVP